MGMGNQRRMGAPFQMGSGGGLVPRGGRRGGSAAFGNSQRFDSATGEDLTQIRPVFGSGGALGNRPRFDPISGNAPPQFMPPAGVGWQGGPPGAGRVPSAPQGGFSSMGNSWMPQNPGGVQAAPAEGARPNAPWGGNDVNSYFLGGRPVNTPTEYTPPAGLLPGSPNLGGIGQPNSGPDQWAGMTGSEIFARLFQRP